MPSQLDTDLPRDPAECRLRVYDFHSAILRGELPNYAFIGNFAAPIQGHHAQKPRPSQCLGSIIIARLSTASATIKSQSRSTETLRRFFEVREA
ncbi:hypothetical protein ACU8KH_04034 [Lachancea thermotolerans]